MKTTPFFSIIIPIRSENDYLKETLAHLDSQKFKSFETLVITDKISKSSNPSIKRNLGASKAKGKYLVFLDDDSYPDDSYLLNASQLITFHSTYSGFCGPTLTPPTDNIYQQASGLFWQSFLGSGGAGSYRNSPQVARFVDDYPTVNLIIKKSDFDSIGGFQTKYWPGEDTILCLDIVTKLHKKIYYHPSLIVYHHRRSVIVPHLQQIKRYALHRGLFARIFPKTSLKIGYLLPSLFFLYLLSIPILKIYFPLYLYLLLLLITFISFLVSRFSIVVSFLATITIPITHIFYGILFLIGLLSPDIKFKPHLVNKKTGKYIGG